MEEIEYLEEYEDLVLPAINSAAGAAANANSSKAVRLDNDGSSSSLDQDIFNCLFDDNSDDDNEEPHHQPLKEQIIASPKDSSRHYLDKANETLIDLGDQIFKELSLENRTKNANEKNNSTKADPRQLAINSKNSGSKIELPSSVSSSASSIAKTVATVRPTVQQIVNYKKSNSIDNKSAATSKQSLSKPLQGRNFAGSQLSTSAKNKFNPRHQTKSPSVSKQRPATIVKPEKIITKDPAEDPLNVDASSLDESASYSVSDISGETYNSISDFDDDDDYDFAGYVDTLDDDDDDESIQSQVIDISNDSSESRSHIEELRGSTPSPVVSEDRCSLPKLMANREIIKSLLSKEVKPKLLNLINEHDKANTTLINKSNEKEQRIVLSTTPEKSNTDLLKTKPSMSEPTVLTANISEVNIIDEHDLASSESCLLRSNDQDEKDSTENSRSNIKSTNVILKDSQTKEVKKNKGIDLPNETKTSHSMMGKRDEQLMEKKVNSDRKDSKSFEQSAHAQTTKPCNSNKSSMNIVCIEKEDEVQTPNSKEVRGEKEPSDITSAAKVQKKRFRNLKTPDGNLKEVSAIDSADKKFHRSDDVDVESKTKEKPEQNVSASVLKTPMKQVNLDSQTSQSKKDKIQEQSIEELNSNRKDSPRKIVCSEKTDEDQTLILKEVRGDKKSSEPNSAQPQRKRFRNSLFSKGSNEKESAIPTADSKCGRTDVDVVGTIGVTGTSSLSALESKTKEKPENKGGSASSAIVKTSKEVSLEKSLTSQSKIDKNHEQAMEEEVNSDKKLSKSIEQTKQPQSSSLVKSNQSPRKSVCSEKFDEAKKPIVKEVRSEKESPKLTSPQPQRQRFRNPSKGSERRNDEETELIKADNKCDRSELDLGRSVDKTRNSSVLAVESKIKEKSEQNVSTSVLPRDSFKNPTKIEFLSNSRNSRLPDSTRDILNKPVIDVPKGVIVNPFVQRTARNILGTKDARSKTPGASPRNLSRESSVESARSSSSTKDHIKDKEKSLISVRSETAVTHNPKQQEHQKQSSEKSEHNVKPSDKVVQKNKSKEIDTKKATPLDPTKKKDTPTQSPIPKGDAEIKTKYPSTKNNNGKNSLDNMQKDQKTITEKKGGTGKSPSRSADSKLPIDEKSQQHKNKDKGYVVAKTLPNVDNVEKVASKDKVDFEGNDPKIQKQFQSIPSHDLSKSLKHLNKTFNSPRVVSRADVSHKTPESTMKKTSAADVGKDSTKLNVRKEPIKLHSKEDVVTNKMSSTSTTDCKNKEKLELNTIAKQIETPSKTIGPKEVPATPPSHSHNAVNKNEKEKFVKASTDVEEEVSPSSSESVGSDKILKIKSCDGKLTSAAAVDSGNIMEKPDIITVDEKKQLKTNTASTATKEIAETSALGTKETLCEKGKGKIDVSKVIKGGGRVRDAEDRKELENFSKNSTKSEINEQLSADTKIKNVTEKTTATKKLRKSENLILKVELEKIDEPRRFGNSNIINSKTVETVCKQSDLKDIKTGEKQESAIKDESSSSAAVTSSIKKTMNPKAIEESRQGDKLNDPPICDNTKDFVGKKPVQTASASQILEQCNDEDDNAKKNNKLKNKKNNLALGSGKEDTCHTKEIDVTHKGIEKNKSRRNSSAISSNSNTNELSNNKEAKGVVADHKNEKTVEMCVEQIADCNKPDVNQQPEKFTKIDIKNRDSTIKIKRNVPHDDKSNAVEDENDDGPSVKEKVTMTKENTITTNPKTNDEGTLETTKENVTGILIKSMTPNRKTRSSKPDEARLCSDTNISSNSPKSLASKDVVTDNIPPANNTTQLKKVLSAEDFNKFEKDQLEKQIKTESPQKALAETKIETESAQKALSETKNKLLRIEIKRTGHDKSTAAEREKVDSPSSVKPKTSVVDETKNKARGAIKRTIHDISTAVVNENQDGPPSVKPKATVSAETKNKARTEIKPTVHDKSTAAENENVDGPPSVKPKLTVLAETKSKARAEIKPSVPDKSTAVVKENVDGPPSVKPKLTVLAETKSKARTEIKPTVHDKSTAVVNENVDGPQSVKPKATVLAETKNKSRAEIKPTVHDKSTAAENENVGRPPSVKPKATAKENTIIATSQNDDGTLENTEENVSACILIKSVTPNRQTRSSKPNNPPTTTTSSKDVVIENTPPVNNTTEMKKNPPAGEFNKLEKVQLEKNKNNEIPSNAFAKTNTLRETTTEPAAEPNTTDQFIRITRNSATTDNDAETKIPCKPPKTISSKDVITENIKAKTLPEFHDTFEKDQLEDKQSNNETRPMQPAAETNKLCEAEEPQAEGSKSANHQSVRLTRSSATTEDDVVSEAAVYSIDGTKSQSPITLKTTDNTNRTPLRTVRRNRNTPSKPEGLGESYQIPEPIVLKGKSNARVESTQGNLSIVKDKNEPTQKSPQKRIRITRCTLGSKADDSTCKSIDFESKHGVAPSSISANKEKTPQSSNSAVKKSEKKTVEAFQSSKMNATQITNENKSCDTAAESSTLCINESLTICKPSTSRDDAINKEWETIAKKEITLVVEEAIKYSETLKPAELTTTTSESAGTTIDSKLTDETTATSKSTESLDTVTLNDVANLSKGEVSSSFADHARRLRKRGAESPFCENRDGDNTTTMFKTPIISIGTEGRAKRKRGVLAAEKELQQLPLAKKMKIDKGKARNRNSDVVSPATSESSSKEFTEPSNETTTTTNVPESHEVLTPSLRDPSSIAIRSTEISSQLSTTLMGKIRLPSQCTIDKKKSTLSHAETIEKEHHEPEWLKGNDKNDSSIQNAKTAEPEVPIKSTSLQELRPRMSIETTTMPNQVTKLHSNVLGEESSKRSRKLKSSSSTNKDAPPPPDNNESIENVANTISKITQENNNNSSIQSPNIQGGGLGAPHKVTQIVPADEAEATKPIIKKSPSVGTGDISPKRSRKLRSLPPPKERNNEATSCNVAMANQNVLVANVDIAHDSITKQKSDVNTLRLEDCTDEKAQSKEITKDFAAASSLTINCPPQKSERRAEMKSGQLETLVVSVNKDQEKIKGGIASSTKQDKKPNKRSEIDILIESMPKEMKDAGIRDLLKNSGYMKRQRAAVAKRSSNTGAAQSTTAAPSSVVNPPEIKETKPNNDCSTSVSSADDILKRSQTKRAVPKKLANTKNSNQSVNAEAAALAAPPLQIEMEKTLIDEVEIKNMNTNLMEPVKYEAKRSPFYPNMSTLKTTPNSLSTPDFKKPKMLNVVNREKTCSNSLMKFGATNRRPTKCRMVKVMLNRRVVKKYFENLRQLDVSNSSSTLVRFKTHDNSIQNKIIEPATTSTNTCATTLPIVARRHHLTKQRSEKNSGVEVSLPEVKEISTAVGERDSNAPKTISGVAVVGSNNSCSSLYSTAAGNIIGGDNGRSVGNILPESVIEPTVPIELKNEFLDENPICMGDTTLPDTPTLIARSQTITQAAANALSNTIIPTDIRLLTNDPISTRAYVPSFGVTPTLVDARGARMYTFLHPAKYSRNHGNVLLDFCCPNLDGPMPAIDPTRIHAQVQTPVIELPSCIVLTTKVVTRAELESTNSTIPDIIRKKAHKIRSNIFYQTSASPHSHETAVTDMPAQFQSSPLLQHQLQIAHSHTPEQNSQAIQPSVMPAVNYSYFPNDQQLSPAVNALAKYLPSTTTITAKIRTSLSQDMPVPKQSKQNNNTSMVSVVPKGPSLLNETQINLLRSNLRRVDVILKSLVQPFEKLNFTERHQVIDNLVASGKFLPKDVEHAIVLTEEYLKQINIIEAKQITDAGSSSNVVASLPRQITNINPIRMPTLQSAPKVATTSSKTAAVPKLEEEIRSTSVRKVQSTVRQHSSTATLNTTSVKQRQVPIYDTERNIIGYQLQVLTPNTNTPSYRKSSVMTPSGGSTSSLGASSNTQRKSLKRPAQDSPRVFYTSPSIPTPTSKANLNSTQLIKPMAVAAKNSQGLQKSENGTESIMTSAGTEKITTTTMATVKRVTRSRAAGSKVIIVSKSSSNEETILPDVNPQAEIKHEKDVEDFIG